VKILGASRNHRSESHSEGPGAPDVPPADARPTDGPSGLKKKQAFATPTVGSIFSKCRLMDEEWHVCVDEVHARLLESGSEFTVVACIGAQGAGKSTVLSLLLSCFKGALSKARQGANGGGRDEVASGGDGGVDAATVGAGERPGEPPAPLGVAEDGRRVMTLGVAEQGDDIDFEPPLEIRTRQSFLEGRASRAGVDLCVSALDRILLLEAQPLFSYETASEAELKSELHFVIFLLSICHTLVVVTDTPVDLQLWKFMRLLAMLKTKVPDLPTWIDSQGDQVGKPVKEVLPRLVVAFNNIGPHIGEAEMRRPVQMLLEHSLWKSAPSLQYTHIPMLPGRSIAEMLLSDQAHCAGMRLRERVLCQGPSRGRFGQDGLQLTEREWLYHINGYWDFLQKIPLVQEYFDTVAQGLESYGWPKF